MCSVKLTIRDLGSPNESYAGNNITFLSPQNVPDCLYNASVLARNFGGSSTSHLTIGNNHMHTIEPTCFVTTVLF